MKLSDSTPAQMYERYLKAWRTYLDTAVNDHPSNYGNRMRFTAELEKHVRPEIRGIIQWPGNWPEVEYWFGDSRDNFTAAVEQAAQATAHSAPHDARETP